MERFPRPTGRGSAPGLDVVQTDRPARDDPRLLVGDPDVPELLRAALLGGRCGDRDPARAHRAQEVGGVVHADGDLAAVGDGGAGADARGALDRRGVDATVHDAPRRVVLGAEIDDALDAIGADVGQAQSGGHHEGAGVLELRHVQVLGRAHDIPSRAAWNSATTRGLALGPGRRSTSSWEMIVWPRSQSNAMWMGAPQSRWVASVAGPSGSVRYLSPHWRSALS